MLDHNFKYKRMVEAIEPLSLNFGADDDFRQLVLGINNTNKTYRAYL